MLYGLSASAPYPKPAISGLGSFGLQYCSSIAVNCPAGIMGLGGVGATLGLINYGQYRAGFKKSFFG